MGCSPTPIFESGWFFCCFWVLWVFYILWILILYQAYNSKISSLHILWVAFLLLIHSVFCCTTFMKLNLSIFFFCCLCPWCHTQEIIAKPMQHIWFKKKNICLFGCTGSSLPCVGSLVALCRLLSCSMQDLVPWPGIKPQPLALEAQSLNCWTSREIPRHLTFTYSCHFSFPHRSPGWNRSHFSVYWTYKTHM